MLEIISNLQTIQAQTFETHDKEKHNKKKSFPGVLLFSRMHGSPGGGMNYLVLNTAAVTMVI